jgi:hypothetical protein
MEKETGEGGKEMKNDLVAWVTFGDHLEFNTAGEDIWLDG